MVLRGAAGAALSSIDATGLPWLAPWFVTLVCYAACSPKIAVDFTGSSRDGLTLNAIQRHDDDGRGVADLLAANVKNHGASPWHLDIDPKPSC